MKGFSVQTKGLFKVEAKYLFQPFSTGVLEELNPNAPKASIICHKLTSSYTSKMLLVIHDP